MNIKKSAGFILSLALLLPACSDTGTESPQESPDAKAIEANNQAVGLMGRFEYTQAQARFAELALQWPQWHEVKINLAIATLNRQQADDDLKALEIAREVLRDDPANLRAHYMAGLVHLYTGSVEDALTEFRYVTKADPGDAHAAYYLAQCLAQLGDHEQAIIAYQRAMELDPYLRSAYYGAFQTLQRLARGEEAAALAADYQRLENNPRSVLAEFKYTRMGPKAEALAIDLASEPPAELPSGALFTDVIPVSIANGDSLQWRELSVQRSPSITTADIQGDGWPDLFVTGVIESPAQGGVSAVTNLLLKGQEGGGYSVLSDHPLAMVSKVNAALWGDFDNDGLVDVYLCRNGRNQLWRQVAIDQWQDVTDSTGTAGAEYDTVDGAFFDADHDGDLDIFLVNANGPNELLNNNLDGSFRPLAEKYGLTGTGTGSIMVLPVDLDNDRDVDLIVINGTAPHEVYINDRLWSYHPADGFEQFSNSPAQAAVVADIDADGLVELYTADAGGALLRWRAGPDGQFLADSLDAPEVLNNVTTVHLAVMDVNGDGVLDLIVSTERGWAVLGVGGDSTDLLYSAMAGPDDAFAASLPLIGASLTGPAMLALTQESPGLTQWQPGPGRFPFITLTLSGLQDEAHSMRSNASGVGTRVAVRTGSRWSLLQNYRYHSAPGQSLQPLAVGLGGASKADFIAIDWSDGVFQSEINVATGRLQHITETQRQLSSCPVLFAWNGEEYAFVSDILGVGGLGYAIGPGEYSTPRPWENFLLPQGLLKAKNQRYELKFAEPMEENAYLDAARLAIYDLPPQWQMVMDERMAISGPAPTGKAFFYRHELLPVSAVNDRGDDVLQSVLDRDGSAAPVGELDMRFVGMLQNEHVLTLDFPQLLDSQPGTPLLLVDGWVEYPYSQTNFAAWQAGKNFQAPTLEAFADGQWHMVAEQFGYPAGMPRRMSLPLPDLPQGVSKLRLRTNMQIYWDRIAIAYAEDLASYRKQVLPVSAARLAKTGFAKRSNLDQFRPDYDYEDANPFWDTRYMAGYYTRLGPVEELVSVVDDAVAIIGPGEEIHLEFAAVAAPPSGWQRFFVLETNGWAKDMDLFTRDGDTVGPLPSTGKDEVARDRLHGLYNTRYQSGH